GYTDIFFGGPGEGTFTLTGSVVPFVPVGSPCDPTGAANICATGSQCDPVTNLCSASICGNGTVESGEQCDDGNQVDTDACSNACTVNGDTCAAPAVVVPDPISHGFVVSGDTSMATPDYGAGCTSSNFNGDLVYQFTTPVAGRWTFEMTGVHDMVLMARTSCADVASEIGCSDSGFDVGIPEEIELELQQGVTLFLIADGYGNSTLNEGSFTITGSVVPYAPPGTPCDVLGEV